jgi:hypothetical protein
MAATNGMTAQKKKARSLFQDGVKAARRKRRERERQLAEARANATLDRRAKAQLRMLKTGVEQVRAATGTVRTAHLLAEWERSEEDKERVVVLGAIARDMLERWKIRKTGTSMLESIAMPKSRYRKIVKEMREPSSNDRFFMTSPSANRFGRLADAAMGREAGSSPWWSTDNPKDQTTVALALGLLKLHVIALQIEAVNAAAAADV